MSAVPLFFLRPLSSSRFSAFRNTLRGGFSATFVLLVVLRHFAAQGPQAIQQTSPLRRVGRERCVQIIGQTEVFRPRRRRWQIRRASLFDVSLDIATRLEERACASDAFAASSCSCARSRSLIAAVKDWDDRVALDCDRERIAALDLGRGEQRLELFVDVSQRELELTHSEASTIVALYVDRPSRRQDHRNGRRRVRVEAFSDVLLDRARAVELLSELGALREEL